MSFVNGIGGIFFKAEDPQLLGEWYEKHFGINMVGKGLWKQEAGITVFSPFKQDTKYFGREKQQFMINFRISDLDKFLAELELRGVKIDRERAQESYGKFAWVYDPEGNKIELWEPLEEDGLKFEV